MLSKKEAEKLIGLQKWLAESQTVTLRTGLNDTYDLNSSDSSEKFILDLWRGTIRLKTKFQTRARQSIVLVRLDLNGAPHTNPDGTRIECPHIHLYREGFGDKWAYHLEKEQFASPNDLSATFVDFCNYCNIKTPNFETTLL